MEHKELANYVSNHLKEFFTETGFKIKSSTAGGFSFEKKTGTTKFVFGCGIASYGDRHVLNSFNAIVYYDEVDQILTPILVRNDIYGKSILKVGIPSVYVRVMFEDYGVNYPEFLGLFDVDKAKYDWKSNKLFSVKKIFGSNIFLSTDTKVSSIDLHTGKCVWEKTLDNAYQWHIKSVYENADKILRDPQVVKLIGVYGDIFWISLDSGRIIGFDVNTGVINFNLLHPVKYPANWQKEPSNNILLRRTQLDVEGGKLFGLNQHYYWEIDLTNPEKGFELFDISDECAKNKIHADMPGYEWPVAKEEIYFAEIRSSERDSERNSIGLFNRKTKTIEWAARIGQQGKYTPIVHKIDYCGNFIYVQDGDATLHVFQKL